MKESMGKGKVTLPCRQTKDVGPGCHGRYSQISRALGPTAPAGPAALALQTPAGCTGVFRSYSQNVNLISRVK